MNINEILKVCVERRASDVHIKVGSPPVFRIDGQLAPFMEHKRLTQEDVVKLAFGMMSQPQRDKFKAKNEADFAYGVPGLGRFRVNVFMQRGTVGLVMRTIPTKMASFDELLLPPVISKLCMESRGMILVTGTTGSGKSTTLASMIDYINSTRTEHIMTVEDHIEFLHRDKKSLVNQREVGMDTDSFALALRSAMRQDPDIILVGEMRDFDTISVGLTAAETGHLLLSTLHTVDAGETINRIISVFPPYQQKQVRLQLAAVLKGVISQRLVPRADGKGRVPACEILVATTTVRECIIDPEKTRQIHDVIAAGGSQYGMQTFDQSLLGLFNKGLITYEEALRRSTNPDDFALKIRGIQSTSDLSWEEMAKAGSGGGKQGGGQQGGQQGGGDTDLKIDRFGE
ncbi:MAG: type IV pilus twitching motility protein PilT [Nitrospirae bacterium]|nr:type IV pilus twitching motility protein PilT [Nitrospirota bacterium]